MQRWNPYFWQQRAGLTVEKVEGKEIRLVPNALLLCDACTSLAPSGSFPVGVGDLFVPLIHLLSLQAARLLIKVAVIMYDPNAAARKPQFDYAVT